MATAEIAPTVSAEVLKAGDTLGEAKGTKSEPTSLPSSPSEQPSGKIEVQITQIPKMTVRLVADFPTARPHSVLFGALVHPNLRLRKAIPLQVSTEEGHVVLSWNETDEFACATTMGEALDDFSRTVSELYFELNDPNVRLGTDLERVRGILGAYIERR